ncbi:hypothetical protein PENSUB_6533 [Penicillium subrubescens]|uniref:Uncharacterized protein n=1 Tax=Penicillium subrubescens TaxID=1316194 RepID=A0A1Q5U0P2_9EURO|nr:hypothetical protein PENSUB_6533 [Penicillium subrubescens]
MSLSKSGRSREQPPQFEDRSNNDRNPGSSQYERRSHSTLGGIYLNLDVASGPKSEVCRFQVDGSKEPSEEFLRRDLRKNLSEESFR